MSTTGRSVAAAAAAARRAATPLPLPNDPFGTRDAATRCALEAVTFVARADPETLATAIVNDAILDVGVRGAHGARRVRRAVARLEQPPEFSTAISPGSRLSNEDRARVKPGGSGRSADRQCVAFVGTCRF